MSNLAYFNVNENDEPYGKSSSLDVAVGLLEQYPNDHIVVVFDDSPHARSLDKIINEEHK